MSTNGDPVGDVPARHDVGVFTQEHGARLREIVREEIAFSAQIAGEQRLRRGQLARQRNSERYSEGSS